MYYNTSRGPHVEIPSQANALVLHGIENSVGYMGVSSGGGEGAMALYHLKKQKRLMATSGNSQRCSIEY